MSFRHVNTVLTASRTTGPARAVLLVLAIRANERGECWPSLSRIARDSGLSRCTVARSLPKIPHDELQIMAGVKTVQTAGGPQRLNLYRIMLHPPKGGSGETPPSDNTEPSRVVAHGSKVVAERSKGGSGAILKSSMNSKEPSSSEGKATVQQVAIEKPRPGKIGYAEIKDPDRDPIEMAMALTGDHSEQSKAWLQGTLAIVGDALFRNELDTLFGEINAGERAENWAAVLATRLKKIRIRLAAPVEAVR